MMITTMGDDSFEVSFAGKLLFFCFGWCCSLGCGFLVTVGIFLIARLIAKDCLLCDKTALTLSNGAYECKWLHTC